MSEKGTGEENTDFSAFTTQDDLLELERFVQPRMGGAALLLLLS